MAKKTTENDDQSQLYARVPTKLKEEFDGACITKGLKRQYVLGKLVEMWVNGQIDVK